MFKKYLSFILCGLLLVSANSSLILAQTNTDDNNSTVSKIKANVLKRGTGENKRVRVRMLDGKRLNGYISRTSEDAFDLTDTKTKQSTTIAYRDVAQVKGKGLSSGVKIGIIVGVTAGIAAVVLGIFLTRYCNEQAC